ncbi:mechanosensitive ion channel [Candidatus Uhrbacteria bacterium]|nr:mechanosensitive ion channel [Candidatus Uhrbacteria bacterium]
MQVQTIGQEIIALAKQITENEMVRHAATIAGIILAALLAQRFAHRTIERMVRRAITSERFGSQDAERRREDTLIRILDGTVRFFAWFIALFFVLLELGVSTTPIVTAAGTIGVAFGIGGQHFMRDLIAGICITFEDQYRVGDIVCINEVTGVVQDITLRITILRDVDQKVHYFSHGTITTVINLREWAAHAKASPSGHAPEVSAPPQAS